MLNQRRRQDGAEGALGKIDHFYRRVRELGRKRPERVPQPDLFLRFKRGVAADQQENGLFLFASVPSHLAPMVARFLLLFERGIFLLLESDQAQI
jgi:hypothetical protein